MKKILWIASYPKSGNTLMRSLISSLIYSDDGHFSFPILENIKQLDIDYFYKFVQQLNNDDYKNLNKLDIISKYWEISQKNSYDVEKRFIFKTHAANLMINNSKYTNENRSLGLIYIVRDPRDVAVSYSYFNNAGLVKTIERLKNNRAVLINSNNKIIVPLSSWDTHVKSWNMLNVPKYIIRYEDLILDKKKYLLEIIDFLENTIKIKLEISEEKLSNILDSTSFTKLQKTEKKTGYYAFSDKKNSDWQFFRKGTSRQWLSELSQLQIEDINNTFGNTMKKYKYL